MSKKDLKDIIKSLDDSDLKIFLCNLCETSRFTEGVQSRTAAIKDIGKFTVDLFGERMLEIPDHSTRYHLALDSKKNIFQYLGVNGWDELVHNYN